MARRSTKAENTFIALALVIGLPTYGLFKLFETSGWIISAAIITSVLGLFFLYKHQKKQQRLRYLRAKYSDESIVQKIYEGFFWEGQSAQQLQDSLGSPAAIDKKLLKTKSKEVWKYNHQGANRFALRITLEDGAVIGWDQKG